jgi:tRNA (guanine37-N1)-methyltransferase
MKVPDVLLSGNHAEIAKWRAEQARLRTKERRPDLME